MQKQTTLFGVDLKYENRIGKLYIVEPLLHRKSVIENLETI